MNPLRPILISLSVVAGIAPRLAAGPELEAKPDVDIVYETFTRRPKIAGVPQLTPASPGQAPVYYKIVEFSGDRLFAQGPYDPGAPCPQTLRTRGVLGGRIAYSYDSASDQVVMINTAAIESGADNVHPWPGSPSDWPLPKYLPGDLALTSSQGVNSGFRANNPLNLAVVDATTAGDNGTFVSGIGGYVCITAFVQRESYRISLSEPDDPDAAESRARLTRAIGSTLPANEVTAVRGSIADGPEWLTRSVTVRYRPRAACLGTVVVVKRFKSRPYRTSNNAAWDREWSTTETVTIDSVTAPERKFDLEQLPGREVALVSIEVMSPSSCASGCDTQSVPGLGGGPRSGSIQWYVPMGLGSEGRSAGGLILHEMNLSPAIYTPAALTPALDSAMATEVRDAAGKLRQVLVPRALLDVVVTAPQAYELRFYSRDQIGLATSDGLFVPTGQPYATWRIENPDATGATANRLRVTRRLGSADLVTEIAEPQPGTRVFSEAGGLRITTTTVTGDPLGTRSETSEVRDAAGSVASRKRVDYTRFAWGVERTREVLDPDGAALTTAWNYGTDSAAGSYRQIVGITRPDGSEETFAYHGNGSLAARTRPTWSSQTETERESEQWLDLNGDGFVDRLTTRTTTVALSVLRLGYSVEWGAATGFGFRRDHYQAIHSAAGWNDPGNLRTRESFSAEGKLLARLAPDGTITVYSYAGNIVTERRGAANATGTDVIDGVQRVQTYSPAGSLVSTSVTDIVSGLVIESLTTTATDEFGRPTALLHLDGAVETRTYCATCGEIESVSLRGETTLYRYDALNRRTEEIRSAGGTVLSRSRFVYDAEGRERRRVRVDLQTGAETALAETGYDLAGRVVATTALGSGTTTIAETSGPDRTTIVTTTYPDGGTSIETRAAGGALLSRRGTAVAPTDYAYNFLNWDTRGDGYSTDVRRLNDDNTFVQERQFIDLLGNVVAIEYHGGVRLTRRYDGAGRLVREVDPDGVATLYAFDARGRQTVVAVDVNRNQVIDYAGPDRITRTVFGVGTRAGVTVQSTATQIWESEGVDSPTTVAATETAVDGRRAWQTVRGLVAATTVAHDGQGGRTVTAIAPDGTVSRQTFTGDRLLSAVVATEGGAPLATTVYAYDTAGRLASSSDARNGATVYTYDTADRVAAVTSPDPDQSRTGPGYDAQTSAYTYDAAGRVATVTQSDGGVVFTTYWPTGSVKRTWGARTVPTEYTYDVQGRIKTLTTWQNFAADSGRAVTTWNYDANRGWLAGKKYHDNSGPSYSYTPAGRLATRTWARTPAVTTAYSYNAAGDPAGTDYSDTTPDVTVSYDRAGRPRTISDAAGTRTVAYHSSGQAEDETYADGLFGGISLDRSFDPLHRLGGIAIRGPQLSALDSYTYSYDSASRLETIAFGAHTAIYGYEADSSLIRSVSLRQQAELRLAATKIYDRLNRLASVDSVIPAGGPIRHAYDYNSANQRSRATREDGSYWNYVYDGLGQVASGTKYGAAGAAIPGHDRAWTYDDIGNRVTATRNSHVSAYTRDLLNRYTQRTVPGIVDVLGTALPGTPVVVSSGDYAAVATRQGDSFFHPIPVDNTTRARVVAVHVAAVQEPAGAALAASQGRTEFVPRTPETFTHDGDGNLVEDGRWRYAWDGENRLAAMETEEGAQAAGVRRTRLEFTYDSQGRRIGKQATRYALGGLFDVRREYFPGSTPGGTPSAIVNGGNIDDIWFQGNGLPMGLPFCYRTTATLRVPTGGAWTFQIALSYAGARLYLDDVLVLDLWNGGSNNSVTLYLTAGTEYRLRYEAKFGSDVGGATFASQLDWSGPQVARQRVPNGVGTAFAPEKVATRYVYDGWNLVAELDAAGAPVRSYAWGADVSGSRQGAGGVGGLLAVTEHTGAAATTHFAATDGNGNVAGLVRAADGSVSARYDYDAFGETVQSDGPAATVNPFRFSTKYTDDESGLLYYGYRFYHAGAGRWLGRDPLEEQGGVNLYGFLINDAVSNIDVLGLAGYFFDGTGNNRKSGTNVFIIYNAYDGIKSYYEGVGSRFGTRVVGGLTGVGGDNRLEAAYRDFIRAVDSGDRFVDIVGFSRGAALGREFANLLDERGYNPAYGGKLKHKLRASTNKPPGECEFVIRFVGLFDTVGSFGVPGNDINLGIRMDLPSAVVNAAQATAQHEMRVLFPLTPLGVRDGFSEQSFPGDHSDVGRGHGKKTNDLSRAPLEYIWNQGRSVGVPFGALPNFTPIGDTTPHDLSRRFPYNIFPKRLR